MRTLNRDEIFEVLIIQHCDGLSFVRAIELVIGRWPTQEEWEAATKLVTGMRRGWVMMNQNIRNSYTSPLAGKGGAE